MTTIYFLLLLLTSVVGAAEFDWSGEKWSIISAVKYLLGLSFIIFGLHFLLYNHLASYKIWKRYREEGTMIPGEVIACDETLINKFEVTVLYTATVYHYKNTRQRFRLTPDSITNKRFMRRFMLFHASSMILPRRGATVRVLLLPGMPKSGMLVEEVERHIREHSHCRTVLLLLPGITLVTLCVFLMSHELQQRINNSALSWGISLLLCSILCVVARIVCRRNFKMEQRFNSAVAMKVSSSPTNP